jgi:hypothetical protein
MNGRPYTESEDKYIIQYHKKLTASMISEDLGKSLDSVKNRIVQLRKHGKLAAIPKKTGPIAGAKRAEETALTRFNYAAIEDSVRIYLASQVSAHRMTYQASVVLMLKLTNHLQQKGAAKLGQMSVLQIVELLQKDQSLTIGETP